MSAAGAGGEAAAPGRGGLSQPHISTAYSRNGLGEGNLGEVTVGQADFYSDGGLVQVKLPVQTEQKGGGIRGRIEGFSVESRRNMIQFTNKLRRDKMPWFITLTLPGTEKISWVRMKRAFESLRTATVRRFPEFAAIWRKELKPRLSGNLEGWQLPHFHLLAWGVNAAVPWREYHGKWVDVEPDRDGWQIRIKSRNQDGTPGEIRIQTVAEEDTFPAWLARMWYEYVGSGEMEHYLVAEHPSSCQRVQFLRGVRSYVGKYVAKVEASTGGEFAEGRWWGVWNALALPLSNCDSVAVPVAVAQRFTRSAKRYVAKQRKEARVKRAFEKALGLQVQRDPGRVRLGHGSVTLFCEDPRQWKRLLDFYQEEGGALPCESRRRGEPTLQAAPVSSSGLSMSPSGDKGQSSSAVQS